MSTHYDVVIIGSGQSGTPLASAFAKAGHRTALVESQHVGGCCINEGCTPTKTLIASGRVAYLARRGQEYGVHTGPSGQNALRVEMEKVRQRKRDIVSSWRAGSEKRVKDSGVDLIMGRASFKDARTISVKGVEEKTITADQIFINTGERPVVPRLEGLDTTTFGAGTILDSTSIQELGVVPEHLVVIGGGYIGLEFGQLFRRLGSHVTILQRGAQLLPREDEEVAKAMFDILHEDGITIHLHCSPTRIVHDRKDAQSINLAVKSTKGHEFDIRASHVLFAAGRTPNTDMLNLDAAGVKTDARGHIIVDDELRTSAPNIWAMGDVHGGPAFTHVSYDDFRIIQNNLLEKKDIITTKRRASITPYVVYTDPQLGHVGLHEHEAIGAGHKVKVASMPMNYVARALETGESRGLMKAVVDTETDLILGFTCLGLEGGELMAVVQMAMMGGVKWQALRDGIFAHPSLAESLNNLWGYLK